MNHELNLNHYPWIFWNRHRTRHRTRYHLITEPECDLSILFQIVKFQVFYDMIMWHHESWNMSHIFLSLFTFFLKPGMSRQTRTSIWSQDQDKSPVNGPKIESVHHTRVIPVTGPGPESGNQTKTKSHQRTRDEVGSPYQGNGPVTGPESSNRTIKILSMDQGRSRFTISG